MVSPEPGLGDAVSTAWMAPPAWMRWVVGLVTELTGCWMKRMTGVSCLSGRRVCSLHALPVRMFLHQLNDQRLPDANVHSKRSPAASPCCLRQWPRLTTMFGRKTTVSGWSAGSDPPAVTSLWIQGLRQQHLRQQPRRQPLGRHPDAPCRVPVAVAIERRHSYLWLGSLHQHDEQSCGNWFPQGGRS